MYAEKLRRGSHPWFQISLIGLTSLLLAALYYTPSYFKPKEPLPNLIQLTPMQVQKYQETAIPIDVGLHIRGFPELDMIHGKCTANFIVWFYSKSPKFSENLLEKFTFERGEIKFRSEPTTRILKDGTKIIEYEIQAAFIMQLNFKNFPLDDHRFHFTLTNPVLTTQQILVSTNPSYITINPEAGIEGWKILEKNAVAGYIEHPSFVQKHEQERLHPRIVFSITLERAGSRQIASILLPLLIIFFVTLLSFTIEPVEYDYYNVLAMSTASILALIAYRFVIETISPVTSYFMLSDYIFMFFLLIMATILCINSLGPLISVKTKNIITAFLHGITIIFFVYLFGFHG
jgi:hypothetical protein